MIIRTSILALTIALFSLSIMAADPLTITEELTVNTVSVSHPNYSGTDDSFIELYFDVVESGSNIHYINNSGASTTLNHNHFIYRYCSNSLTGGKYTHSNFDMLKSLQAQLLFAKANNLKIKVCLLNDASKSEWDYNFVSIMVLNH